MFATPFTTPLHETLVSHVFGRFLPQRAQGGGVDVATSGEASVAVADDDAFPDLAQRVREVGEW